MTQGSVSEVTRQHPELKSDRHCCQSEGVSPLSTRLGVRLLGRGGEVPASQHDVLTWRQKATSTDRRTRTHIFNGASCSCSIAKDSPRSRAKLLPIDRPVRSKCTCDWRVSSPRWRLEHQSMLLLEILGGRRRRERASSVRVMGRASGARLLSSRCPPI